MDNREAKAVLQEHLQSYRQRPYCELVTLIGKPQVVELRGASGSTYRVEVEVFWDDHPRDALRVLGSVDDGGWRAWIPLSADFIVAPDGTFVGE